MTTECVHANIEASVVTWRTELLKFKNTPGKYHVTYVVEVLNGVPRKTIALGGHLKDEAILAHTI